MGYEAYIASLLKPRVSKPQARRVWSIELEGVWLPFFTATNAMEATAIPHDALGAPLRLAKEQDGAIKFSKAGRPVVRVVKPIADQVRIVRENFVATIMAYTQGVIKGHKAEYNGQVELARQAGRPIIEAEQKALDDYLNMVTKAQEPAEPAEPAKPAEAVAV